MTKAVLVQERELDHDIFEVKRKDGRSNTQVICDLVGSNNAPGRVFSYKEIGEALSVGSDREFDRPDIQQAVRNAGPKLGKIHQRALQNVRQTGYRLAKAEEHMGLAVDRQVKASRQLKRGYEILRDVKEDEIKDEQVRLALRGQFLVMSGLFHAVAAHERRLGRVEKLIDKMLTTTTG